MLGLLALAPAVAPHAVTAAPPPDTCPAPLGPPACTPPVGSTTAPPALPPHPNPPSACTAADPHPPSANSWTEYGNSQVLQYETNPPYGTPTLSNAPRAFVEVVDAGAPCRAYRISSDRHRIERSLDFGMSWATVVDATSTGAQFRRIYSAGAGVVYVAEVGNGDALIRSGDGGTTWSLADGRTSDPVNLIGEYTFAVATRYDAATGTDTLYVATLKCFGQRPQPAVCSTTPATGVTTEPTPPQTGDSGMYNHGPMRLYVSRNGGRSWNVFAGTPTTALPDCDVGYLYLVTDPYSPPARDHMWVVWRTNYNVFDVSGASCPQAPGALTTWLEATYTGSGYQYSVAQRQPVDLSAPPVVTRAPTGALRLVNPSWPQFSDDDGNTWQAAVSADVRFPQNAAALPGGDVVGFRNQLFGGVDTEPSPIEPRAIVWRGGDMLHPELGATFPTSPPGTPLRNLYGWPHYDTQLPTLERQMLADVTWDYSRNAVELLQVDGAGNVYVNIGEACPDAQCVPGAGSRAGQAVATSTQWARWHLMRYTPGPPGSTPTLKAPVVAGAGGPGDGGGCANNGRCNLVPVHQCTLAPAGGDAYPGSDADGALAFDGRNLYYTRTGERSTDSDASSAVIHRVSTADLGGARCRDSGPIVIHLDAQQYDAARQLTMQTMVADPSTTSGYSWAENPLLPAERPHVDAMTYDAVHDRLYFTLTPENPRGNGAGGRQVLFNATQLALWQADLHSVDGVPSPSVSAHLVTVNTGYCHDNGSQPGASSETLAFDRVGDNLPTAGHADGVLWGCLPSRPAELELSGQEVDQPCYGAALLNGWAETGIHVGSWTMEDMSRAAGRHRAFLLNTNHFQLDVFDLNRCANDRVYTYSTTNAASSAHGSQTLACDPVTYGSGVLQASTAESATLSASQGLSPFGGSLTGAVLWQKRGPVLTANLLPDNDDALAQSTLGAAGAAADAQTCRLPVSLTYTGPVVSTPGRAMTLAARLSVDGPNAPAAGQLVQVTVDGVPVPGSPLRTDSSGVVHASFTPPSSNPVTVAFAYAPQAGNVAFYPAGPLSVVLGTQRPVTLPPTAGPPVAAVSQPQPGPPPARPPAGLVAPPPVVAEVVPAGQAPPQSGGQGQGQSASARARERERQLAMAGAPKPEQNQEAAPEAAGEEGSSYAMSAVRTTASDLVPGLMAGVATLAVLAGLGFGLRRSVARGPESHMAFSTRSRRRRKRW